MKSAIYQIKDINLKDTNQDSPLDKWYYKMIQKSVEELTIVDVSHMLRQEIFLDIAIPCAWEKIIDNPLCGEMYDGQMIELLTRVFISNPSLKEKCYYIKFVNSLNKFNRTHKWDNEYEKIEYEKILFEFKALFQ